MALHKEIAKLLVLDTKLKAASVADAPAAPTVLTKAYNQYVYPLFFKYVRAPIERWNYATTARYLRQHGMMYDDFYNLQEPVIDRAVSLLPADLATARYRRLMRGQHLNMLRYYLPLEEQNYDPFLPYLAPYIEEAKFQIQEEEELLGYHPYDRRFFSGSNAGFAGTHPEIFRVISYSQLSYVRHLNSLAKRGK